MAKYVIDGATLTAIADRIRAEEASIGDWRNASMTPEEMPDAIGDVRYAGYQNGYSEGYQTGYVNGKAASGGDLEALGALCEWEIIVDSDSCLTIYVINYHPTYYLHCVYISSNPYLSEQKIVVPPQSGQTAVFEQDQVYSGEGNQITNVRWKKSAT